METNSKLEDLKSRLDGESKLWVDIIVDELQNLDEELLKDFLDDPYPYMPNVNDNVYQLVMKTILETLKYKDADIRVVEKLEKVMGR